jgi:hypothetical protein
MLTYADVCRILLDAQSEDWDRQVADHVLAGGRNSMPPPPPQSVTALHSSLTTDGKDGKDGEGEHAWNALGKRRRGGAGGSQALGGMGDEGNGMGGGLSRSEGWGGGGEVDGVGDFGKLWDLDKLQMYIGWVKKTIQPRLTVKKFKKSKSSRGSRCLNNTY